MLTTNSALIPTVASLSEWPVSWFTPKRYRPGNLGTWSGHLTFANDLIKALRPSLIVELGTQWGEAYFTFCQSVAESNLSCTCYAIDHWRGEPHAGFYEEEVYEDVAAYNAALYASFSYLLRSSFDEAVGQFNDGSIDLLHIDGLHTYEAVKHDFENWFPKVRPGGFVLLHDIMARHENFGVWRLWEEITKQFSDTFEFQHNWGLGVLRKPGGPRRSQPFLDRLCGATRETAENLRRYYVVYSSHLEHTLRTPAATRQHSHYQAGLYPSRGGTYAETDAIWQTIPLGEWHDLTFNLRDGTGDGPLRFCPSNAPCCVEFDQARIVLTDTQEILWQAAGFEQGGIGITGTMVQLQGGVRPLLISTGIRPVFLLPVPQVSGGVRFEGRIRISTDFVETYQAMNGALSNVLQELRVSQNERGAVQSELCRSQTELAGAHLRLNQLWEEVCRWEDSQVDSFVAGGSTAELRTFLDATTTLRRDLAVSRTLLERTAALESELIAVRAMAERANAIEGELARTRDALQQREQTLAGILHSLSWKLTVPFRKLSETLRRAK